MVYRIVFGHYTGYPDRIPGLPGYPGGSGQGYGVAGFLIAHASPANNASTVCPGSSYPNLYNELLYKLGNYFLDIGYFI